MSHHSLHSVDQMLSESWTAIEPLEPHDLERIWHKVRTAQLKKRRLRLSWAYQLLRAVVVLIRHGTKPAVVRGARRLAL